MLARFLVGLVLAAGCGAELTDDKKQNLVPDSGLTIDAAIDALPPVDARPCTGGDARMQDPSGTCFILFTGPKIRADAEADCVALGGHLATVKSATSNTTVTALVANTPSAFLGATDLTTENTFLWPDGSALTYTNWRTGEPNNGGTGATYQEDCVVIQGMLGGVWDDRPCAPPPAGSGSYAYVCSY
ncbi:MAG: C-type lectin domain-containing protein [Deltaproteobacteria bacterium]|nr:C-type lectin domain-containing protein [Deltaproteobacteria bacterium]